MQTAAIRNALASAYATACAYAAAYSSAGSGTAGTEPTGGSPAYARVAVTWSAPSNGVITASYTWNIPSGFTVAGGGYHSAATGGTYYDGFSLTSQGFSSQGTLTVSATFTET